MSVNSHVCPYLHEWLLLSIWNCTCDPRFVNKGKRWQSLELHWRQNSFYFTCTIVQLMMILARAIFRSCGGFCTRVDTRTCDRTCLRAWTGASVYILALCFSAFHRFIIIYSHFINSDPPRLFWSPRLLNFRVFFHPLIIRTPPFIWHLGVRKRKKSAKFTWCIFIIENSKWANNLNARCIHRY